MNIAEAKARLSTLIEAVERGEEVILARAGTPVARLEPFKPKPSLRFGVLKDIGWTGSTPYEAFAPEPEDAADAPLVPGDPTS